MKKGTFKIILTFILLLGFIILASNVSLIFEKVFGIVEDEKIADSGVISLLTQEIVEGDNGTSSEETDEKSGHLRDKSLLYTHDNGVVTMYLTVNKGNKSEGTDHTWEEINTYSAYDYQEWGVDRYKVEALLQVGTEAGISPGNLGYGRSAPNATVQVRGQTSSRNVQKNYKIELKNDTGDWNGQTTIALNKHQTDGLRFRNRLGFEMLTGIDQLLSLRTTFVHLYVNDLTDGSDDGFEDYGLYTQVEQLNKKALRAHGLDRNGHLYKVNFFEFFRYEDAIKLASDPGYDKNKFEQYLEIKGNEDHSKLIKMLEDVNDMSIPVDELIEKHFDEENLTYWLAFNILTGNVDTQSRNCYLYSPQNKDTWYFLCWDLDGSFRYEENELEHRVDYGGWVRGVSNYWGNMLFQRCLKSDRFREKLDAAVKDVRAYLTEERLRTSISEYRKVTDYYLGRSPDMDYAYLTSEEYDILANGLPKLVDFYYQNYLESLLCPLPFYIGDPVVRDDKLEFVWDVSYDFQQDDITYKAVLARDLEFTEVIDSYSGYWPEFSTDKVQEPGQYFLKVEAVDDQGNSVTAFDYYESDEIGKSLGVLCFYLTEDGKVSRFTVEE